MNDANEPSYYEIALTNRQVLVAFVLILGAVLGAFLSGVWLGRKGVDPLLSREAEIAQNAGQADDLDELESFRFFTDPESEEGQEELDKPDLSRLLEEPDQDTTLAQDVGSQPPAPRRATEPEPQAPSPRKQPAPPPRTQPAPPPAPPPKAQPTAATEGFIVQVLSTRERAKARRILGQLEAEGFKAFISPLEQGGVTMYRVRIGPFAERVGAEKAAQRVKDKKLRLDTWVTAASN